jgi:hypothetical protein
VNKTLYFVFGGIMARLEFAGVQSNLNN